MIDKIKKRLSGWKSRNLSLAGRVTLPQSSLLSILAYIMQITPLPASACKDIENLCQYFIWGSTHDRRKVHLIFWEDICKPKDKVLGLGFRNVYLLNKCYILKLSWQLIVDRDALIYGYSQGLQEELSRLIFGRVLLKCGLRLNPVLDRWSMMASV
ncbi:hypothetical protein JHK86_049888 [Glycine max]|nr:hypothetical protein JHK86_049888 [Glycine max]